jgi:hypothetical protein
MDEKLKSEGNFFLVSAEPISNTQPVNNPRAVKQPTKVALNAFSENINMFLAQMNAVLENTPGTNSAFQFVEIEVAAEINARGQIILKGTGSEPGLSTGIRFVFRKLPAPYRPTNLTL